MPQIAQIAATYASQAFWMLLVFGVIYFVIARGAVGRVGKTIDNRAAQVSGDLASAQAARDAAQAAEIDYDARAARSRGDAVKLVADAKAKTSADTAARLKTVDGELGAKIDAATADIGTRAEAAMAEVRGAALDAAAQIVTRLTGEPADAKALAAAVAARS
jgi:F-type H+-transporting ATPase subunit b